MMRILLVIISLALLFNVGCKKEFDQPPIKEIPVGNILTIQQLRDTFAGSPMKFDEDFSVFATITMDEGTGNIYRNVFIQDPTGAINLRMLSPGGLYLGDSIRINLNGVVLNQFNGVFQLDSVNVDKNIVKLATKRMLTPQNITMAQVSSNLQSRLVQLNNVEFVGTDVNQTFADGDNQISENRILTDCDGNTLIVRTSGFADFANDTVPFGNGTIVGILSEFNGDYQLYVRSPEELVMNGERCTSAGGGGAGTYLFKDFQDQSITSGGWFNYTVTGAGFQWETSDQGSAGNFYAKASGFSGGSNVTEQWLISPAVDLSSATAPGLEFRNAYNFNGPQLQLMVSTDYDGISDPSMQGNWQDYSSFVTWSTGGFAWVSSDVIPLTGFVGQTSFYIAIKYVSSATQSSTWEVDDIIIEEQ